MTAEVTQPSPPTAEQILEAGRRRRIKELPYLDGIVHVYGMTRPEAKAYSRECADAAGSVLQDEYRDERMIMHMVRDAAGNRIFKPEHLTRLADLNEADFRPLYDACCEVNGFGEAARETLRKNSGKTPSDASGSGSPPTGASA